MVPHSFVIAEENNLLTHFKNERIKFAFYNFLRKRSVPISLLINTKTTGTAVQKKQTNKQTATCLNIYFKVHIFNLQREKV